MCQAQNPTRGSYTRWFLPDEVEGGFPAPDFDFASHPFLNAVLSAPVFFLDPSSGHLDNDPSKVISGRGVLGRRISFTDRPAAAF